MNRPNDNIWFCVGTMKLLNELALSEEDTFKALNYLFPDVYAEDSKKCLEQVKNIKTKPMLAAYTPAQKQHLDYIKKDMDILKKANFDRINTIRLNNLRDN